MMEYLFTLKLAETAVQASTCFPTTAAFCAPYLWEGEADLTVSVTPEDISRERIKAHREDALEGKSPRPLTDAQLEITALQRKIAERMFDYDTLVFHGSVVAVDGQAYLFTAKSGTGKSTHTGLWRQVFGDRAVMINDDKPFLRIREDGVTAYGSPWNGKHGLGTNTCAPLKAVCILERGRDNSICRISPGEALFMLLQQSNRPMDKSRMPLYMDLLDKLSRNVRFYRMQCNMDPSAAVTAYEAMSRNP